MKRMEYADIKALLSPFIDGELDPETMHAVERTLAECDKSRALVDEAEALNDLIVRDAVELGGAATALPPGFADAVLNRTVRETYVAPTPYFRQWTTWSGWFAAAACLALAVTIYVRNATPANSPMTGGETALGVNETMNAGTDGVTQVRSAGREQFTNWSWVRDDFQTVGHPKSDAANMSQPIVVDDGEDDEAFFSGADLRHTSHPFPLSSPEVQTLIEVANVMESIAHLDVYDPEAIDEIQLVIESNNLLLRLEDVRAQLQHLDQTPVFAAASILRTATADSLDLNDLEQARADTRQMELPTQIRQISDRVSARLDL